MIEVEIKVKISDPELMRKKFENQEGVYKISLLHEDTYFNMPKELRDFKKTDEALRIRKSIAFNKKNKDKQHKTAYYLTYKGKKIDNISKTRKELEIQIEKGDNLIELLKILEFQEIYTVKKERELYDFNFKNYIIEVLIDFIPILKEYFIEVEYMIETQEKIEEAREILFGFLETLGINKEQSITKSYLELIADKFKGKFRNSSR
jgi:adenylate cyclase class 2